MSESPSPWTRVVVHVWASPILGPIAVVVAAAILSPFVGVGSTRVASSQPDVRTIYLRDCATCHAPEGTGTSRGPTLAGQGAAGVDFMLTTGRMPSSSPDAAMKRRPPAYAPDVIAALDSYVSQLVPGGPAIPSVDTTSASVTVGGSTYREQCAACHQAAGEGGVLLGQNSPPLLSSTPVQIAEALRSGPGTMPVFGPDAIPDRDVPAVAKYILVLQHVDDPGGFPLGHLGPLPEGAVALVAMGVIVFALRRIGTRT